MTNDTPNGTQAPAQLNPGLPGGLDQDAIDAAVRESRRGVSPAAPSAPAAPIAAAAIAGAAIGGAAAAAGARVAGGAAAAAARAPAAPSAPAGAERSGDKRVFVYGKNQVMAVFANPDGNYSVAGYGARAHQGFGDFFLGMDEGPEYERQSRDINAAIQSITAEEGFALGVEGTRTAYRALTGGGGGIVAAITNWFRPAPAPDVHAVSTEMLASISKTLFGIPDGDLIITGAPGWPPNGPSLCPGDFAPVSGALFRPDPGAELAYAGAQLGRILARQVGALVARLRASRTPPPGRLTRVLFDTIPPEEDARLVRTLIGTMMGLLPTVDGNLIEVMKGLHDDGEIPGLKARIAALGPNPGYERVRDALKPAIYKAMQRKPVPQEVWRTAVHDHVIGAENPVAVKKGDMVVVSIERATRADLAAGTADVSAIFGGWRTGKGRRPTHGCPGHAMAMGIIFGAVAVILEQTD